MKELPGTIVHRGGVTSPRWSGTIRAVTIRAAEAAELWLGFTMPSKGGGDTEVRVEIKPEGFATLIQQMCAIDRQTTMEAMVAELARQVRAAPERERKVVDDARNELKRAVQEKAARKCLPTRPGQPDTASEARIVLDGVRKLFAEVGSIRRI